MAYYSRKISIPFHEAVERISRNLHDQGFGVITTMNMQHAFRQSLRVPFRNYMILSACNPHLAYQAISLESHVGAMLPCNIVVQEHENGETEITAINPLGEIDAELNTTILKNIAEITNGYLRTAIDDLLCHSQHADALPTYISTSGNFPILG